MLLRFNLYLFLLSNLHLKTNPVNNINDRIPDPPRGEGQYPSEIELLLRDYSRAREEARTEIAKARERLRERTEQEKRRLQQALSQETNASFFFYYIILFG